ncbi:hypothetical protein [Streptomyces roseochromogenus]|uniref:Uncharacterized protein n=1 Tax=Streptomyces roseochromogenus subsp. oscitans DS 12.976 TaxID=1352936 RepID=V6JX26_STRRC|nr:hypothetical protein [Streptomyces roseochromogenus]EST24233.1 hypothetical protein M878_31625 [Streptomyces roseochromogenus subsp. oscitans DS 12.976]
MEATTEGRYETQQLALRGLAFAGTDHKARSLGGLRLGPGGS